MAAIHDTPGQGDEAPGRPLPGPARGPGAQGGASRASSAEVASTVGATEEPAPHGLADAPGRLGDGAAGSPEGGSPARGPETADALDEDGIPARVQGVEQLPLGERAEAYQALHDELVARLDDPQEGA